MKKLYILAIAVFSTQVIIAQTSSPAGTSAIKFAPLDKSPLDVIYYPVNYPVLKIQDRASEPLAARLIYSRPQKGGRSIFGDLVSYGETWRLGANEATELELFTDAKVDGKKIAKGRYSLFAIPEKDRWTLIFNRETDTWGAFKYDATKDVLRVTIPTEKLTAAAEAFSAVFVKTDGGANLVFAWDDVMATLPFSFK